MTRGSAWRMWLTVCLLGGLSLGCTRGKAKDPAATRTATEPAAPAQPAQPGAIQPSEDWLSGKLPASVLEGTPTAGGEAIVAIESDPPSLNTLTDSDLLASYVTNHRVYQSLIRLDVMHPPKYEFQAELAERWEISEDQKTYTFYVRKGVRWHDGQPFTARDLVATFDKIMDPTTKAVHVRSLLEELASYSAADDFTFVMRWKRPYAFTLNTLSDIEIQPAHFIAKLTGAQYNDAASNPIQRKPIGTGPFRFATWESNNKIVIERNPDYWGDKTYLDRVVFRVVPNATVRLQLAERGEIDLIHKLTSDHWRHMDSPTLRRDWNRSRFFPHQYVWIGWNQENPLFKDKRVRRALTSLVDRPGIIDKLLYGLYRPTTCHFYWASEQCDPEQKPLPYDPPAAIAELEALGWKDSDGDGVRDRQGKPFRFVFMIAAASEETARWTAKVKEDFGRAGIAMDIQRVEWSAFIKRMTEHKFDAATLLWGNTSPFDDPTQVWASSGIRGGSNFVSFRNAEADSIMQRARVEFDVSARNALYRKLGAILHEEQPYTWMYNRAELAVLHKRLKGAKANLAWWNLETMWIDPALRRN